MSGKENRSRKEWCLKLLPWGNERYNPKQKQFGRSSNLIVLAFDFPFVKYPRSPSSMLGIHNRTRKHFRFGQHWARERKKKQEVKRCGPTLLTIIVDINSSIKVSNFKQRLIHPQMDCGGVISMRDHSNYNDTRNWFINSEIIKKVWKFKWKLGQNCDLGRGRWSVTQKLQLIMLSFFFSCKSLY